MSLLRVLSPIEKIMMRSIKNKYVFSLLIVFLTFLGIVLLVNQNSVLKYCFPHKVWVHRVNSIKKQKDVMASNYGGLELDVIYDGVCFDVNHGPEPSIGLNLYSYVDSLPNSNIGLWLDFKNLNADNCSRAVCRLDSICDRFSLDKSKIIVESSNPQYLSFFSDRAYLTSYYLPAYLYQKTENDKFIAFTQIDSITSSYLTDYISCDRHDYAFVRECFPERRMLSWGFYTWGFYADQPISFIGLLSSAKSLFLKLRMLMDDNVEVLLVSYNSDEGNR